MSENKSKKTTLVYFGDLENSKYGTLRSIIALVLCVCLFFSLSISNKTVYDKLMKNKFGVFLSIVAIVSALCVVVPYSNYDALKYGASVGAFLSIIALTAWYSSDKDADENVTLNSLLFFSTSTVVFSFISFSVYFLSEKWNWYPVRPCQTKDV